MPSVPSRGQLQVKFARINVAAATAGEVVAAVTGKAIRVLGYAIVVDATATVTFQDTAGTPVIHAEFELLANGGVSYAGHMEVPAFQTAIGTGVEVLTGALQEARGHLTYVEV